MPGRRPTEAVAVFLEPLQSAISCVGTGKITLSRGGRGELAKTHLLTLNDASPLDMGSGLSLDIKMHYEIVRLARAASQPFRVTTRAYMHTIKLGGQELMSAHWHPTGVSEFVHPHWHIGGSCARS